MKVTFARGGRDLVRQPTATFTCPKLHQSPNSRTHTHTYIHTHTHTHTHTHVYRDSLPHRAQALRIYRLRIPKSGPEKKQGEQGAIDQGTTLEHATNEHDAFSQANIE